MEKICIFLRVGLQKYHIKWTLSLINFNYGKMFVVYYFWVRHFHEFLKPMERENHQRNPRELKRHFLAEK